MTRYLTGNWYTDPRGQHMSWQDYERAFEEQERKKHKIQYPEKTEEEKEQDQINHIINDCFTRITDYLVENGLISYPVLYEKTESCGRKAVTKWIFGRIDQAVVQIYEKYIFTSEPTRDILFLSPSFDDMNKINQGCHGSVKLNTRMKHPAYISKYHIKRLAPKVTEIIAKQDFNKSSGKIFLEKEIDKDILNELQKNDTYMRIEQQNDKECIAHWGDLYKLVDIKI